MQELVRCISTAWGPSAGTSVSAFLEQVAYTAATDTTAAGLHSNICRRHAAPDITVTNDLALCTVQHPVTHAYMITNLTVVKPCGWHKTLAVSRHSMSVHIAKWICTLHACLFKALQKLLCNL